MEKIEREHVACDNEYSHGRHHTASIIFWIVVPTIGTVVNVGHMVTDHAHLQVITSSGTSKAHWCTSHNFNKSESPLNKLQTSLPRLKDRLRQLVSF
jgi:hypothetical protein